MLLLGNFGKHVKLSFYLYLIGQEKFLGAGFSSQPPPCRNFRNNIFAHVVNGTGQGSSHSMPYRKRVMPNCGLVRSTRKRLPLKSACGPSFCTISCKHFHQSVHGSSPGAVSFCGTYTRPLSDNRKGVHYMLPKQSETNKFFEIGFNWARSNKFLQNLHSVPLSKSSFSSSVQCDVLSP